MSFRPAGVNDTFEIVNLVIEYNVAFDAGDPRFAETFTDDGIFDSSLNGVIEGHQELIRFLNDFGSRYSGRHFTSNHVVTTDGDKGRHESYFYFLVGSKIATVGRYEDELVRVDGKWKFKRRIFRHDEKKQQ